MRRFSTALIVIAVLAGPAFGQFTEPIATDKAFPIVLVDATDGYSPETEKKAADTTITYCNITDGNTPSSYTDDATTWKEIGDGTGEYKLVIGAGEFATAGKRYLVKIVVSGCRTTRLWVDTRLADPNLTATTTDGSSITVDPNGNVLAEVNSVSKSAGLADTAVLRSAVRYQQEAAIGSDANDNSIAANSEDLVNMLMTQAPTTVAVVTDATTFTITAGSTANDYYNQAMIVVQDVSDSNRRAVRIVRDFTGASRTVKLDEGLPFLPAAADPVYIYMNRSVGRGRVSP
jgi:hypothetical protein